MHIGEIEEIIVIEPLEVPAQVPVPEPAQTEPDLEPVPA